MYPLLRCPTAFLTLQDLLPEALDRKPFCRGAGVSAVGRGALEAYWWVTYGVAWTLYGECGVWQNWVCWFRIDCDSRENWEFQNSGARWDP